MNCEHGSRVASPHRAWALLAVAGLVAMASPVAAQQSSAQVDSLRREVARLHARLDSLQAQLESTAGASKAAPADPLAALRAAAANAAGTDTAAPARPTTPEQFVGRQRMQPQLNPEVTVTGDLFAFENPDQPQYNNIVPREFEVAMQSTLDPYSRAKLIFGYHNPGGEIMPFPGPPEEGGGFGLGEGYVQWVSLPGGLGITVGQFRQRFGTLNRWHTHALPGQMLPLPYLAFFGEEGLAQPGVSLHWLAPVHGLGGILGPEPVHVHGGRPDGRGRQERRHHIGLRVPRRRRGFPAHVASAAAIPLPRSDAARWRRGWSHRGGPAVPVAERVRRIPHG
ncbi:MAG: hypothetical protein P8Z36_16870 [Gemmatimonadota bacterium]